MLKITSKIPQSQEPYLKTQAEILSFLAQSKGKDLFPDKTARVKKIYQNIIQ